MVAEDLGGHPAEAEDHQGAEHGLLYDTDQHFDASGEHRLDEHTGEVRPEGFCQFPVCRAYLLFAVQAELHRAGLCLVDQAFRLGLEHHRATEAGGGPAEGGGAELEWRVPLPAADSPDSAGSRPAPKALVG